MRFISLTEQTVTLPYMIYYQVTDKGPNPSRLVMTPYQGLKPLRRLKIVPRQIKMSAFHHLQFFKFLLYEREVRKVSIRVLPLPINLAHLHSPPATSKYVISSKINCFFAQSVIERVAMKFAQVSFTWFDFLCVSSQLLLM